MKQVFMPHKMHKHFTHYYTHMLGFCLIGPTI